MQEPQTGLTSPTCRTPPGQKSGHPPDSSRADLLHPGFDVTLLSNDTSTATPENEDCAPSSRSPPDASCAPFPHRSPRRSSANAACGGLQPPSARAATKGQTFISRTAPCQEALPTNRTPFHVRGTRSFSNPVSFRDPLTCGYGACITQCHRAFVSNSCHFSSGTDVLLESRLVASRLPGLPCEGRALFRPYRYRWVFELAFLSCERPWDVGYGSVSSARGWLTVIGRSAFRDDSTAN